MAAELHVRGLATWQEQPLSPNSLSRMLHNPFYVGQVVVKGRQTPGKHQPLVSPELFSQVQTVLAHRRPVRRHKHVFRYRGRLQCAGCQRCLIGEKQKQHIYYRCGRCKGICVREDRVWDVDRRFSILFMAAPGNKPLLEPYEKFDSAKGGRRFEVL
ncbi:MAG: recombinase family protein [Haliea sp.]